VASLPYTPILTLMIPTGIILRRSSILRVNSQRTFMDKCFKLAVVRDLVAREVVHISGIRSHGPATGADVAPPWPPQDSWRARLRQGIAAGKAGKP